METTDEDGDGDCLRNTASSGWMGGDGSGMEFESGALAFSGSVISFSGIASDNSGGLAWTLVLW